MLLRVPFRVLVRVRPALGRVQPLEALRLGVRKIEPAGCKVPALVRVGCKVPVLVRVGCKVPVPVEYKFLLEAVPVLVRLEGNTVLVLGVSRILPVGVSRILPVGVSRILPVGVSRILPVVNKIVPGPVLEQVGGKT